MNSEKTKNYALPQWRANDRFQLMADLNPALEKIDSVLKDNEVIAHQALNSSSDAMEAVSELNEELTVTRQRVTNNESAINGLKIFEEDTDSKLQEIDEHISDLDKWNVDTKNELYKEIIRAKEEEASLRLSTDAANLAAARAQNNAEAAKKAAENAEQYAEQAAGNATQATESALQAAGDAANALAEAEEAKRDAQEAKETAKNYESAIAEAQQKAEGAQQAAEEAQQKAEGAQQAAEAAQQKAEDTELKAEHAASSAAESSRKAESAIEALSAIMQYSEEIDIELTISSSGDHAEINPEGCRLIVLEVYAPMLMNVTFVPIFMPLGYEHLASNSAMDSITSAPLYAIGGSQYGRIEIQKNSTSTKDTLPMQIVLRDTKGASLNGAKLKALLYK